MNQPRTDSEAKLGLVLSAAERKLLQSMPVSHDGAFAAQKASEKQVWLSVVQLDELADALSLKANHTEGRTLQRRLDTLVRKIDKLTGSHFLTLLETKPSA